jgi:hypothetical protein
MNKLVTIMGRILVTPLMFLFVWMGVTILHQAKSWLPGVSGFIFCFDFACVLGLWLFRRDLLNTWGYVIFSPAAMIGITFSFNRIFNHPDATVIPVISITSDFISIMIATLIVIKAWAVLRHWSLKELRNELEVGTTETINRIELILHDMNDKMPVYPVHAQIIYDLLSRQFNINCYVQQGLHFPVATDEEKAIEHFVDNLTGFKLELLINHLIIVCRDKFLIIPNVPVELIRQIEHNGKIVVSFALRNSITEQNFILLSKNEDNADSF